MGAALTETLDISGNGLSESDTGNTIKKEQSTINNYTGSGLNLKRPRTESSERKKLSMYNWHERSGEWILQKEVDFRDQTGNKYFSDQVISKIQEQMHDLIVSEVVVNIPVGDSYATLTIKSDQRRVKAMQMKFNLFKYYTFIWALCALLLGVFTTTAITGTLGPLSSFTGILMSLSGIIGVSLDWKDRERTDV
ncbi:hypothetical protein [Alteribacter populi]|uniref:hypothetical protein n=1 Tax=Alteribacter populi TaxID=2011011 RepID=UPI0012FFAEF6|nr:hypothetical protein [Alteribacter populi]